MRVVLSFHGPTGSAEFFRTKKTSIGSIEYAVLKLFKDVETHTDSVYAH